MGKVGIRQVNPELCEEVGLDTVSPMGKGKQGKSVAVAH